MLKEITYKNLHNNNLGSNYLNIFKKNFGSEEICNTNIMLFLKRNSILKLIFLFLSIIYFFIKNL